MTPSEGWLSEPVPDQPSGPSEWAPQLPGGAQTRGPSPNPPGTPQRLHWLTLVFQLWRAMTMVLLLMINLGLIGFLAGLVFGAASVVYNYLAWTRLTYQVIDGKLRVESGIVGRRVREVPITRIQQVDLRRQIWHRMANVVAVRIDTAGGGSKAEVVLDCLSEEAALLLRAELADPRHRSGAAAGAESPSTGGDAFTVGSDAATGQGWSPAYPGQGPPMPPASRPGPWGVVPGMAPEPGEVLASLSTRDLAVAGVTGSGLVAGLSVIGFLALMLGEIPTAFDGVRNPVTTVVTAVAIVAGVMVVAIPVLVVAAVFRSVMRDHEFTLTRYGNDLHARRGLLDQREMTIATHRIQAVWVMDNPLRRRLGAVTVEIQSAGGSASVDGKTATNNLTVPLVRTTDLAPLLASVLPGWDPAKGSAGSETPAARQTAGLPTVLFAAPAAARRRSVFRSVWPVALVVLTALVFSAAARSAWGIVSVVLLAPAVAFGLARYRGLAHGAVPNMVVARTGALIHRTALVPIARSQSFRIQSSPFQRRVGLATLSVQVAGRGRTVAVVDVARDRCRAMGDHALGSAEARRDEAEARRRVVDRGTPSYIRWV